MVLAVKPIVENNAVVINYAICYGFSLALGFILLVFVIFLDLKFRGLKWFQILLNMF